MTVVMLIQGRLVSITSHLLDVVFKAPQVSSTDGKMCRQYPRDEIARFDLLQGVDAVLGASSRESLLRWTSSPWASSLDSHCSPAARTGIDQH